MSLNICLGVEPRGKLAKPNIRLPKYRKTMLKMLAIIYKRVNLLIGWKRDFLKTICPNELRIRLAYTKHQGITFSRISNFNLSYSG